MKGKRGIFRDISDNFSRKLPENKNSKAFHYKTEELYYFAGKSKQDYVELDFN